MEFKLINDINRKDLNKTLKIQGKIITIKQTSGPTLMVITDGTANFTLKAFIKPGQRAYPEIDIDNYVDVEIQINDRNNNLEGEVKFMKKLSSNEINNFEIEMDKLQEKKFKPEITEFSIKSKGLETQKDRFIDVAKRIRKAVVEGRPILIRHNADTDGYSSAITLERAILKLMNELGGDPQAQFQLFKRSPSKAPFYEYEDSIKDAINWLKDNNRSNVKAPLILITDNGSTEEDILSIQQMKIYGSEIIVIDHHFPGEIKNGKALVDNYIDAHINPYLTGYDSNLCAGILGYELARFVLKDNGNSVFIPAMAAILDHTEGEEKEQYIKLAETEGFTQEYLAELGEIIDMQSHYLRFLEAREYIDELFGKNMKAQKKIVEMLTPELKKRYLAVEKVAEKYANKTDFGSFYMIDFDGEKGTFRGEYPAIGKSTNHIHKYFEQKLDKPIITVTHGTTFMTIRVSDGIKGFSVPDFVQIVFKETPYANANGGGHEHAGSVRFVEFARQDIFNLFKQYLKEISKKN